MISLGDRLAAGGYFDRAPVPEMVRHLRNGVAHGNRFTIRNPDELRSWPAHTRDAVCRGDAFFEITEALDGSPVLFEFMVWVMQLPVGIGRATCLRKAGELLVAVPVLAQPCHPPGGDLQRRKQCGGAVADVVVGALLIVAGLHRQHLLVRFSACREPISTTRG